MRAPTGTGSREWMSDKEPVTELGRLEADHYARAAV
jgi:hypothetical protein